MRRRTWSLVASVVVLVVLLLGLVVLLGSLRSGAPYYVVATPVEAAGAQANTTALNATALPPRRFPFTTTALARATESDAGRSDPYWEGPIGLKDAFTHSPFDELASLRQRSPEAVIGEEVLVRGDNRTLRIGIDREAS